MSSVDDRQYCRPSIVGDGILGDFERINVVSREMVTAFSRYIMGWAGTVFMT